MLVCKNMLRHLIQIRHLSLAGHAGGAGKTTLGRVVYNQLLESWGGLRAHVRVDHVDDTVSGEAREQREALALREAMGSLLRQLDDDEPHPEFAQRVGQLAAVLKHPVLLLLDNVRDKVQLDCLLPGMPEQGAGRDDGGIRSHILITTRSDAQLREAGISVYSMPPMGAESARDLFKAARGGFETPPAFLVSLPPS